MVYALSASYVMYFYQDVLGLSATFVGLILMAARVFDALNDPFMGVLVAKTKSRWGRFRPWLLSGTILNAVVLYALFNAPHAEGAGLMAYPRAGAAHHGQVFPVRRGLGDSGDHGPVGNVHVSVLFVAAEILCCAFFKENSQTEMETAGVKEMFAALLRSGPPRPRWRTGCSCLSSPPRRSRI